MSEGCARLHVVGFGLALGLTWSLGMLCLGLMSYYFAWGTNIVVGLSDLYIGFTPTLLGSIVGALWGFVDMFIAGMIIALIYNFVAKCCCKS